MADHDGMTHADFKIGAEFFTGSGKWVCTDIGTRVIVALKAREDGAIGAGPPYAECEMVFDEYDFGGCSLKPFED